MQIYIHCIRIFDFKQLFIHWYQMYTADYCLKYFKLIFFNIPTLRYKLFVQTARKSSLMDSTARESLMDSTRNDSSKGRRQNNLFKSAHGHLGVQKSSKIFMDESIYTFRRIKIFIKLRVGCKQRALKAFTIFFWQGLRQKKMLKGHISGG